MSLPYGVYGGPVYQPRDLPGQGASRRMLPTAITRAAVANQRASHQAAGAAPAGSGSGDPPPPGGGGGAFSAYQWLLAWAGVVVLLWAISRTAIGYRLLYWGVVLMILLILVTQSTWFAGVFAPIASLGPMAASSGSSQGS